MGLQDRKVRIARLSVLSNTALVAMKIAVGLMIGSVSIMSEAIHSGVDLLASLITMFSVGKSSMPADAKHPFGHGKFENISGTIEALLILLAAVWIIYEAIKKLLNPQPIEYVSWGVGVMLISALVNIAVSKKLFKVARETGSIALEADGWHLRTDVYTSAGVMTSLAMIWTGHLISPATNLYWLDPVAAIAVALLIMSAAYRLTVQSAQDLMDVKLPAEEEAWIRQLIMAHRPVIHGFHRLRTRKAGNYRFVDCHIKVDPAMSVEDSHRITDELSRSIEAHFPHTSVTVHIEPCDGRCDDDCLSGCLLPENERKAVAQKSRQFNSTRHTLS
ncbi:MAG: cation diffusion facilitator family transporter [Syntrophales bacterium]